MKNTLVILSLIFMGAVANAGNEGGGGTMGIVAEFDMGSEAVLWDGFQGDLGHIKYGIFSKDGWLEKEITISAEELQKIDVRLGNAINESALTKNWISLK